MDTNSRWKYFFLYVGALLVIIVITYLLIATKYNIPLVSLLPSNPLTNNTLIASPTPRVKPTSVKRLDFPTGIILYTIKGKFVTPPAYVSGLLRSDFVIDEDPFASRIPVFMTKQDGAINVGKATDASFGHIVWTLTPTEELRKAIHPNAPALLQIEYFPTLSDPSRIVFQPALDHMIQGTWDLPENFILVPVGVGVVQ